MAAAGSRPSSSGARRSCPRRTGRKGWPDATEELPAAARGALSPPEAVGPGRVVVPAAAVVARAAWESGAAVWPPLPEEITAAVTAPARASTATPAAIRAFLTRRQATLARGEEAGRRAAQRAPREARRLRVPRRARGDALHRQGKVAAVARAELLPGRIRRPRDHRAAPGPGRGHRGDRHRHRGRGAPPRAEPRQAPPAAVQRQAPRRQVVPVHRRHRRGRLPAGHVHARAAPARGRLLRAVREREEGARDARRAQPRLPLPAVRGAATGPPLGDPVPRLPHRTLPGPVRRLHLEEGLPRDHRPGDRVPLGRDAAHHPRARAEDEGSRRGRALRGGGALPQPVVRRPAPRRAAGGGQALGRDRRRDRDRRRRRPRGGAGLPAPRRTPDRPVRVPPREHGRAGHGRAARDVLPRVLRLRAERAAADRRPARLGRHDRARGVPRRAARLAGRGARARARREAAAPGAGDAERAGRARVGRAPDRAAAAAPSGSARGAARGAEPREPPAADRVLRRLEPPGRVGRRLDGRLPGRARRRRRTTASSECGASTGRTTTRRSPR